MVGKASSIQDMGPTTLPLPSTFIYITQLSFCGVFAHTCATHSTSCRWSEEGQAAVTVLIYRWQITQGQGLCPRDEAESGAQFPFMCTTVISSVVNGYTQSACWSQDSWHLAILSLSNLRQGSQPQLCHLWRGNMMHTPVTWGWGHRGLALGLAPLPGMWYFTMERTSMRDIHFFGF